MAKYIIIYHDFYGLHSWKCEAENVVQAVTMCFQENTTTPPVTNVFIDLLTGEQSSFIFTTPKK
jgi:hypothetical protein